MRDQPLLPPEGEVVAEHRGDLRRLWARTLALGGLGAFWVTVGIGQLHGEGPATLLFGLGALLLLAESWLLRASARAVVRADGLERWGLRGKLWSLKWSDAVDLYFVVERIRLEAFIPIGHRLTLRLADAEGKRYSLPNALRDEGAFLRRVLAEQERAQLPGMRARLAAGEEVSFGTLSLVGDEVRARGLIGGSCKRSELTSATISEARLVLVRSGKLLAFAKPSMIRTKNVFPLLTLLEEQPGFVAKRDLGV